jgi:LDH2 family malate/lactate/ureidoglycolate dehydrogenase
MRAPLLRKPTEYTGTTLPNLPEISDATSGQGGGSTWGRRGVYTPNPIAAAWPTAGDPGPARCQPVHHDRADDASPARGRKEISRALGIDNQGVPSDDPAVVFSKPPGALLPIGVVDHGHKGYALGLLVEALTGGLAGHGRADPKEGWTSLTCIQVYQPALFGGTEALSRQMTWLSDACQATPPRAGFDRVRLSGENGLRSRETQLKQRVDLYPNIVPSMRPWSEKSDVPFPAAKV